MKIGLIVALSLVSGMAFAGPKETSSAKKMERTTEEGKKEKQGLETKAVAVEGQKAQAGKTMTSDSSASQGIDYLKKVAAKADGNKVYEAAGGIAEAAATGDARSVEVASRLAELIKSEKDVLKAFDRVVEEFKLNKEEVLENCKS
ncbi:MAG: hypothetical protein RJB66_2584 [Pseudomonadota bacterium]